MPPVPSDSIAGLQAFILKVKEAFLRKETNEDFNSDIDEKIFTECGASCRSERMKKNEYRHYSIGTY